MATIKKKIEIIKGEDKVIYARLLDVDNGIYIDLADVQEVEVKFLNQDKSVLIKDINTNGGITKETPLNAGRIKIVLPKEETALLKNGKDLGIEAVITKTNGDVIISQREKVLDVKDSLFA